MRQIAFSLLLIITGCGTSEHGMRPKVSRSSRLWWEGISPEPRLSSDDWQRDKFLDEHNPQRDRVFAR